MAVTLMEWKNFNEIVIKIAQKARKVLINKWKG